MTRGTVTAIIGTLIGALCVLILGFAVVASRSERCLHSPSIWEAPCQP